LTGADAGRAQNTIELPAPESSSQQRAFGEGSRSLPRGTGITASDPQQMLERGVLPHTSEAFDDSEAASQSGGYHRRLAGRRAARHLLLISMPQTIAPDSALSRRQRQRLRRKR